MKQHYTRERLIEELQRFHLPWSLIRVIFQVDLPNPKLHLL